MVVQEYKALMVIMDLQEQKVIQEHLVQPEQLVPQDLLLLLG
jgi:hypothetical protein